MVASNGTRSKCPRGQWFAGIGLTLGLHYAWEMLQAPLFTNFTGTGFWGHAWPCFRAAVGDVLIAGAGYLAGVISGWRADWPFRGRWKVPLAVCLAVGLGITVALEHFALSTGRWGYRPAMPTIGGIGLMPLLQWIIVPTAMLVILRRFFPPASLFRLMCGEEE